MSCTKKISDMKQESWQQNIAVVSIVTGMAGLALVAVGAPWASVLYGALGGAIGSVVAHGAVTVTEQLQQQCNGVIRRIVAKSDLRSYEQEHSVDIPQKERIKIAQPSKIRSEDQEKERTQKSSFAEKVSADSKALDDRRRR